MKKKSWIAIILLNAFVLWTVAVTFVDVAPIGPSGSSVGFAALNGWFHRLTGVHMTWYIVTDWLGLVPIAVAVLFAMIGLCQWIRRKRLALVDADIWLLGAFYIVTIAVYLLFEMVVINHRPVLIEGVLEASYPSSTTLLTLCVMGTALLQARRRIGRLAVRCVVMVLLAAFCGFMVLGRLLSGVHWFTDIVGGILLSGGLVTWYDGACHRITRK